MLGVCDVLVPLGGYMTQKVEDTCCLVGAQVLWRGFAAWASPAASEQPKLLSFSTHHTFLGGLVLDTALLACKTEICSPLADRCLARKQ